MHPPYLGSQAIGKTFPFPADRFPHCPRNLYTSAAAKMPESTMEQMPKHVYLLPSISLGKAGIRNGYASFIAHTAKVKHRLNKFLPPRAGIILQGVGLNV